MKMLKRKSINWVKNNTRHNRIRYSDISIDDRMLKRVPWKKSEVEVDLQKD